MFLDSFHHGPSVVGLRFRTSRVVSHRVHSGLDYGAPSTVVCDIAVMAIGAGILRVLKDIYVRRGGHIEAADIMLKQSMAPNVPSMDAI